MSAHTPGESDDSGSAASICERRQFLRAAVGGIASVGLISDAVAGQDPPAALPAAPPQVPVADTAAPPAFQDNIQLPCNSDYMIDVLRSLSIDHVAFVPGNTFKGLHESVINYGQLTAPKMELISCMHEEASVAIAHGYAKVAGKPMACMMHSTVGLQHASMAIYNAWADRVPIFAIVGAQLDATRRDGFVDWEHAVFDGPALVRDFTKWDDTPVSLGHFAESAVRAYRFAMTPPHGPVLLALDQNLQESAVVGPTPPIPSPGALGLPRASDAAIDEIARWLASAENPVIIADRAARTPAGLTSLIELAETVQAAVIDCGARMNFPWRHPLNQTSRQNEALAAADFVLALELTDLYGTTQGVIGRDTKVASISSSDLYMKSNYQDFNRIAKTTLAVAADAETTLPALTEAVKRRLDNRKTSWREQREKSLAQLHQKALEQSRAAAAIGWDEAPITTARLCMSVYDEIKHHDWGLVSGTIFQNNWPQKLWHADRHHQYIGDAGAYGLGYLPGASVGAAVAHRKEGRMAVAIGGDGDLMFSPGMLWTAAHHKVPLLYVVHNNRAYHQEVMYIQSMANRRGRGIDRAHIGNAIQDPAIDFAGLARSMGVYAEGPVTDPKLLGPTLRRAVKVVLEGGPALVDVISQGR